MRRLVHSTWNENLVQVQVQEHRGVDELLVNRHRLMRVLTPAIEVSDSSISSRSFVRR